MSGRDISEMVNSYHRQQDSLKQLQRGTDSIRQYIANIDYAIRSNSSTGSRKRGCACRSCAVSAWPRYASAER